jgi:hypothetical protein
MKLPGGVQAPPSLQSQVNRSIHFWKSPRTATKEYPTICQTPRQKSLFLLGKDRSPRFQHPISYAKEIPLPAITNSHQLETTN